MYHSNIRDWKGLVCSVRWDVLRSSPSTPIISFLLLYIPGVLSISSACGTNTRHNFLRDLLASWAARTQLQPELQNPDLPCPQRLADARVSAADLWMCWLWPGLLLPLTWLSQPLSGKSPGQRLAKTSYAEAKAAHLQTARSCAEQGVRFIPLVAEATGAREKEESKIFSSSPGRWRQGRKRCQPAYTLRCFRSSPSCSSPTGLARSCAASRRLQRQDDSLTCRL